jgi:hypothetical protein
MQHDEFARRNGRHRVGTPIVSAKLHLKVIVGKALDYGANLARH